jgi:hypothetical protein
VAVVAIHAVIDISPDAAVLSVGLRPSMTIGALENCVITRIGMTGGADSVGAAVTHGKPGVIKGCVQPRSG